MIDLDEKNIVAYVARRNTVARKVMRMLGAGMGAISLLTGAHTMYTMYQNKKLENTSADVIHQHDSLMTAMRRAPDSIYVLNRTINQLRDSLTRSASYIPVDAPQSVPLAVPRVQKPQNPCGLEYAVEQGGYSAMRDKCHLDVEIPRGGSISGASLAYFGDMHRWKQDKQLNMDIDHPDLVEPGTIYRFSLP